VKNPLSAVSLTLLLLGGLCVAIGIIALTLTDVNTLNTSPALGFSFATLALFGLVVMGCSLALPRTCPKCRARLDSDKITDYSPTRLATYYSCPNCGWDGRQGTVQCI